MHASKGSTCERNRLLAVNYALEKEDMQEEKLRT